MNSDGKEEQRLTPQARSDALRFIRIGMKVRHEPVHKHEKEDAQNESAGRGHKPPACRARPVYGGNQESEHGGGKHNAGCEPKGDLDNCLLP